MRLMLRGGMSRALLALELTALVVAAGIILLGGYRGSFLGIGLRARSAYRPLLLFSIVFPLRVWLTQGGPSPERRVLEFIRGGWREDSRREAAHSSGRERSTGALLGEAAVWASLGASIALAEETCILALGYSSLFPGPAILVVFIAASMLLYAAGTLMSGCVALLLARLSLWRAQNNADSRGIKGEVSCRSLALFPLLATALLSGRHTMSLEPSAPATRWAGLASLAGFIAGVLFFTRILPAAARAARRPAYAFGGVLVLGVIGWGPWHRYVVLPARPTHL